MTATGSSFELSSSRNGTGLMRWGVRVKCGPLASPSAPTSSNGPRVMVAQYSTTRESQLRPRVTPQMSLNVASIRLNIEIATKTSMITPVAPSVPL